mgnify:CR=1 FL=1|jgi:hypothetical protein
MEEVIKLNAVDQYNKMFGLETLHPLVSVVDLSEATGYPRHFTLNYGVYALFLKNTKCGDIRYGKQYYDYQEGTVTSFAPGQVTEVNMLEGMQPSASGLLFHPDLIKGTSLGQGIKQYSFFSYSSTEALHLSEDEKKALCEEIPLGRAGTPAEVAAGVRFLAESPYITGETLVISGGWR